MGKFELIDSMIQITADGKLKLEEDIQDVAELLAQIYSIVWSDYAQQIRMDITNRDTSYYAPEYSSWKEFLNAMREDKDYSVVLLHDFSENQLETLWKASHIEEELLEEQIKREMLLQIEQLKLIDVLTGMGKHSHTEAEAKERMQARLCGLYQILYE